MPPATLFVDFSRPIKQGPLANLNWFGRVANLFFAATAAVATGSRVTLTIVPLFPLPGPDIINYNPPPFDVIAFVAAEFADAFFNFPITP